MQETTLPLLKRLNVPLLTAENIAELKRLEKEWRHWEQRESEILPSRISEQQKAAYSAFVSDPTPENEQRLFDLADIPLTIARHTMLRRAFKARQAAITAKAGAILMPIVDRASAALDAEYEERADRCGPVMGGVKNHPEVRQVIRARDAMVGFTTRVYSAKNGHTDLSPLALADDLMRP